MRNTTIHRSLLLVAAMLWSPAILPSQCGGQGNLSFEIVSVGNTGTIPGSTIRLRITGLPNQHICIGCDTGQGPVVIPGIGTMCLSGSPNLLEFAFQLPPSGFVEITLQLPKAAIADLICCQVIGLDRNSRNGVSFSNSICFKNQALCTSGGFREVGYITRFPNVTSFPIQVTSTVEGRAGGSGSPSTGVAFNPANPPTFPITSNGSLYIEDIALLGSDLYVTTFVKATSGLTHNQEGRLPNELDVTVKAGNATNSFKGMHVSCSQPFGVGMLFGPFRITLATPFKNH